MSKHCVLILKTFKDQVTLFILKLFDLVFSAHIIKFKLTGSYKIAASLCLNLSVEHMRAQIKYSAFVDLIIFILTSRLLTVLLYKETYLITELALSLANL